jgi:2-keto-4-pentenoate hydratase/2-oxohepta-3-ene-1,7-dioic acid hydratase in catechol pathway
MQMSTRMTARSGHESAAGHRERWPVAMRVGRLTDGERCLTAIHVDGHWFALRDDERSAAPSVLDVLVGAASPTPEDEPLPDVYRPAVPHRPGRDVICLGKNFRAHAEEFAAYASETEVVPEHPIVFTKAPQALCGASDEIAVSRQATGALDYEAELAVVIGRSGAAIQADAALSHVAGYTVLNDVTARDLQERHKQWFLAKSLPRATPVGPVVVTPDELPRLGERTISCSINGTTRQSAVLADMIFGVAQTISIISALVPLVKGDLISMGTPAGVGIGFTPPAFLEGGDEVVCAIEGIGELRNVVRFVSSIPTPTAGETAHSC